MLVAEGPEVGKLPDVLLFSPSPPPAYSWPSDSEADAGDSVLSLSPPVAAGNKLLVVAAVTADVEGTELESPSRRMKFT